MIQGLNQFGCHESCKCSVGHTDNQVWLQRAVAQLCNCSIFVVVNALLHRDTECFFEIGNHFWVGVIGPVQNFNGAAFVGKTICNWFSNEWKSDW